MTNLNLMTHCGAQRTSLDQVMAVPAPPPTRTHHPISHGDFLRYITDGLTQVGLKTVQSVHATAHEGMRYFGMMEVEDAREGRDYSTVLGFRNANDKRFTAGLVVGSGVFVCDNLCFSGEVQFGRRHTQNIFQDLPQLILDALRQVGALRDFQEHRINQYRDVGLTTSQVNDLVIAAMDEGVIPSAKIGQVLAEFSAPRHPEFVSAGESVWRLMNAFTEILKPRENSQNDLFHLAPRTQSLHTLLDRAAGVLPQPQKVEEDAPAPLVLVN